MKHCAPSPSGYFQVTSIPKKCTNTSRFGLFFGILLRAADVEVDLLRGRIHFTGGLLLVGHRVVHPQRLPIANALRDHEVHLVVVVQRLAVQRRVPESPSCEVDEGLRPVVVAASGIGAVLVQESHDAAVLARIEFVELVDGQDEIAFRNLQPRLELCRCWSRSLTSISAVPDTGFTVLASLSRWSQPTGSFSPPTMWMRLAEST